MTAAVWVVAGPPGAGKSTVAGLLAAALKPRGALLDKDTLYGDFVAATLAAAGRPFGEREGDWYDRYIKVHEYAGLVAVAREVRRHGCPPVLVAPFTAQIHDPERWSGFVDSLGGAPVELVWVRTDPAVLHDRLVERASPRDAAKLGDYDRFVEAIRAGQAPPVAHHEVDNRPQGTHRLAARIADIIAAA
jgi:predicted kinase